MLALLLMLMGDFTYTATTGCWLDFSRSGPLSEDRLLIVEQKGKKGEYHRGARQMIFDDNGVFLYDIPEAANAWVIINGFLGDPDTYIYQTRTALSWIAWNSTYGSRPITAGENDETVLGQIILNNDNVQLFKMVNEGHRLVFLSKVSYQQSGGMYAKSLLEVLDFADTPKAFFEAKDVIASHTSKLQMEQDFSYHCMGNLLTLYDLVDGMRGKKVIYTLDLQNKDPELVLTRHSTSLPVHGLKMEKGFLVYTSRSGTVFERLGKEPIFVLKTSDKERDGYKPLQEFLDAVGTGSLTEKQGHLSFIKDSTLIDFDLVTKMLRHFPLQNRPTGRYSTSSTRQISCNGQTFEVKEIPAFTAPEGTSATLSISAAAFTL